MPGGDELADDLEPGLLIHVDRACIGSFRIDQHFFFVGELTEKEFPNHLHGKPLAEVVEIADEEIERDCFSSFWRCDEKGEGSGAVVSDPILGRGGSSEEILDALEGVLQPRPMNPLPVMVLDKPIVEHLSLAGLGWLEAKAVHSNVLQMRTIL